MQYRCCFPISRSSLWNKSEKYSLWRYGRWHSIREISSRETARARVGVSMLCRCCCCC